MPSPLRWYGRLEFLDGSDPYDTLHHSGPHSARCSLVNAAADWVGCLPDEIEIADLGEYRAFCHGGEVIGWFGLRLYSGRWPEELIGLIPTGPVGTLVVTSEGDAYLAANLAEAA